VIPAVTLVDRIRIAVQALGLALTLWVRVRFPLARR
jgi:hypothetical protein